MMSVEGKIELTVITAVRNAVSSTGIDSLYRCVNSIAKLDIPYEHIVQDGLSTDNTLQELNDLKKGNSNLIVQSEQDTGIYNALNKAIKISRGEWIYVLGADDYIVSAENMTAALRYGIDVGADIVTSQILVSCSGGDGNGRLTRSGMLKNSFFCSMPYPHQGMLMRKRVIEKLGGFNECFRMASDYDLTIRALLSGVRVVEYDKPYAYYSTNGISSTDSRLTDEYIEIRSSLFCIDNDQAKDLGKRRILPWRVWWRYCLRSEPYFKRAIRFHLFRNLANNLGLINKDGVMRWKGAVQ